MRFSTLLYGAMQVGIVGGFIWWFAGDPTAPDVGLHVPAIIGTFFAVLATAIVYWTNRGIRRLRGLPNESHGEPVFTRSLIDLSAFAPKRKPRGGKHGGEASKRAVVRRRK